MKTFNDYKKEFITAGDSAKSKVGQLQLAIVKQSRALSLLRDVTLDGKYTYIPIVEVPEVNDTDFTIGSIKATKQLLSSSASLVDETVEDAALNMEKALDNVITSLARLKLEKYVADSIVSGTPATGPASDDFASIVALVKSFPESVYTTEGKFIAVMSYKTWLNIVTKMTTAEQDLVRQGIVTLAPLAGMDDKKIAVIHTHGVAFGFNLLGLEKYREGGKQQETLLVQLAAGFGADTDYLKYIVLA